MWKGGFGTNPPSGGPAESINKSTHLCKNLSIPFVQPIRCDRARARLRPAAAGFRRVGGQSLRMPSTCTPLSPRALKRSRYGGDALGRPSRASSCPRCDRPMALSARACCAGGAAAKAPTQRAARRNRRRMWCLGLRLDAQGGGGGGGGYRSYLCSTPSSCDGVECVFAFPAGGDAPSGASVHAGSTPPAHVLCRLRRMDAISSSSSGRRRRTLTRPPHARW